MAFDAIAGGGPSFATLAHLRHDRGRMPDRPRPAWVVLAAFAAASVLWVAERIVASAHGLARPPLSWRAHAALLGLHVGTAIAISIVVGVIARLHARRSARAVVLAAASGGIGAGVAAHTLASGPWISMQWFAPLVTAGGVVLGAVGGAAAARFAFARGRATAIGLAIVALASIAADATIEVGHHPAFHLAAWSLAAIAITLGALRIACERRGSAPRGAAWVVGVVSVIAIGSLPLSTESTRAELLLRSPLARQVLRAATRTSTTRLHAELADLDRTPPEPAADADASVPSKRHRNVLVITIDALRADALPPVRTGDREHAREGDTPRLDAFVASAVAFRHAYAPASFTMRSLPATFASRPATEEPASLEPALPRAMASAGRVPLAVVDRYFIEEPEGRALLEEFDLVQVHAGADMKDGVGQLLGLVDQAGGRPFFAWLHLFATHTPGYAGRMLKRRDGTWPVRYRKAVRWVDREVGRLLEGLAARGLAETTVVVLSSDHGEGLGDNGIDLHGESVFEEEVRVPLAIRIPGANPAVVDAPVSLVDLAPTLLALVGAPPDPRMVGRSLVPLLRDPGAAWPHDVHTMSRRDTYALVRGRDKIVYDAGADVMLRFDLAADPTEDDDRFGDDPALDGALRSAFVRANPQLFASELEDPGTLALLLGRVRAIDPRDPPSASTLEFLLELCALAPGEEALEAALDLLAAADDATRERLAIALLPAAPQLVGPRVVAHLATVAGTPAELALVDALADAATPAFAMEEIAERMAWWLDHGEADDARPWAELVARWPHKPAAFVPPLARLLSREPTPSSEIARHALLAVEGLDVPREDLGALDAAARARLSDPDVGVRAAACTALVTAGAPDVLPLLASVVRASGEDIRVRQLCLKAAAFSARQDAVSLVIEQAGDPLLTFYAIRLLETLRSPAAIGFLEETIEREKRGRIHAAATLALRKTLEARP